MHIQIFLNETNYLCFIYKIKKHNRNNIMIFISYNSYNFWRGMLILCLMFRAGSRFFETQDIITFFVILIFFAHQFIMKINEKKIISKKTHDINELHKNPCGTDLGGAQYKHGVLTGIFWISQWANRYLLINYINWKHFFCLSLFWALYIFWIFFSDYLLLIWIFMSF